MAGVGVSVGAALGLAANAQALTYEVDNLGDAGAASPCVTGTDNDCSLRQAVDIANGTSSVSDVIVFEAGLSGSIDVGTQLQIFDTLEHHRARRLGPHHRRQRHGPDLLPESGDGFARHFCIDAAGREVTEQRRGSDLQRYERY